MDVEQASVVSGAGGGAAARVASRRSGWTTGRRLLAAFGTMVLLSGAASGFALYGLVGLQDGLARTRQRVEGLRLALELSSAVRDQYAHIAHTVILGNDSHLDLYDGAQRHTEALTAQMRGFASSEEERAWVSELERSTAELDETFRARVMPAVLRGEDDVVRDEHHHVLMAMAHIQDSTGRLARGFSDSVSVLQTLVTGLQERALWSTLVFLVLGPALAVGAGLLIGRSVARPIARLEEGAERIAAGDLDTRLELSSQDEFGALASQFNAMAAAVKEHQAARVENERLVAVGRLAAGVAHEINNPLGVILGYVKVLQKRADGALAEDLRVIEAEALRSRDIVEGLLDLARPVVLGEEDVDLRELADDVAARLSGTDLSPAPPIAVIGQARARGDATRLRQVLFNLVKNAVEAAGAQGRVDVSLEEREGGSEVSVRDTGPGFAPEVRERLFEPFFTTKPQGTGLGLAVCHAIARAHGGALVVGAGSLVTLVLPHHTGEAPR